MRIYKDIISDDEMFSDAYTITEFMDGIFYKVKGEMITVKADDIDGNLIGANASAEDQEESTDCGESKRCCNIVDCHRLVDVGGFGTKKAFLTYMKGFSKNVVSKLEENGKPDQAAEFKKKAEAGAKYIIANLKEFDVFCGEHMDNNGSHGFMGFEEDGMTPFLLFFKHALVDEKV